MSPTTLPAARRARGLRGIHVLLAFLAFFGTVFAVNGSLIYAALSTYSGIVANEPYRKGLHYNDRIVADERQGRLAWTETLDVSREGHVRLSLARRDGGPVAALTITGMLGRPATQRQDTKLALIETKPGLYEANAGRLADGTWVITLDAQEAARSEEPIYRLRRRLWFRP